MLSHFICQISDFLLHFSSSSHPSAMSDSDDDVPTLSAHTLAALQEFYNESSKAQGQSETQGDEFAVGAVEEDWVGFLQQKHLTLSVVLFL